MRNRGGLFHLENVMSRKVAIYARVSTDEQSLDSQLNDLREYCRARGWEATEYTDHGISGAKDTLRHARDH